MTSAAANAPAPDGERRRVDFVVLGCVVTMNPSRKVIPDGAVAVSGGEIIAVGERAAVLLHHNAHRTLGGARTIVLPGMIDAHTHCTQCFVRSLTAGELPMIPRLYVPAQRSLTPDQAAAAVRLIAAQLLRAGVTTLCEGTLIPAHEEPIIEALEDVGIRCCLARGSPDQDFYHAALYVQASERSWVKPLAGRAEEDLRRTEVYLQRFPPSGNGLIRAAVNASALTGFSEAYFREGAALARRHGATLQVHIARDREEVEFCLGVWGCRPIERLAAMGVVDEHLVAVHAVLATEREIRILGECGASLAHSPAECVGNLNAVPDVQRFRRHRVPVALGCDNQGNDMFATMRAAHLVHGALWGIPAYDPEYLQAEELLAMATSESARVLRWDDRIGSLETGKAADLVVLDGGAPHMMAAQDVVTEIVRYASRGEVLHTMVNGRLLYDRGTFETVDIDRLYRESRAGAAHVRDAVSRRRYRALAPRGGG